MFIVGIREFASALSFLRIPLQRIAFGPGPQAALAVVYEGAILFLISFTSFSEVVAFVHGVRIVSVLVRGVRNVCDVHSWVVVADTLATSFLVEPIHCALSVAPVAENHDHAGCEVLLHLRDIPVAR